MNARQSMTAAAERQSSSKPRPGRVKDTVLDLKNKLRIGTANVDTLLKTEHFRLVDENLFDAHYDIVALQETRLYQNEAKGGVRSFPDCHYDYYYANAKIHKSARNKINGVAFAIQKKHVKNIISWEPISDRIIKIRLKGISIHLTLICVYSPTNLASEEDKNIHAENLNMAIQNVSERDMLLVLGDFNAELGEKHRNEADREVVGRYLRDEGNENDQRLIETANRHKLAILGSFYQHKPEHTITFTGPNRAVALDHILVRQRWRTSFQDCRTFRKIQIAAAPKATCHYLVGTTLKWKIGKYKRETPTLSFDRKKIAENATEINKIIKEQRKEASGNGSKWQTFEDSMIYALKETCQKGETTRHKPWITKGTLDLIKQKAELYRNMKSLEKEQVHHSKKVQTYRPAGKTLVHYFGNAKAQLHTTEAQQNTEHESHDSGWTGQAHGPLRHGGVREENRVVDLCTTGYVPGEQEETQNVHGSEPAATDYVSCPRASASTNANNKSEETSSDNEENV